MSGGTDMLSRKMTKPVAESGGTSDLERVRAMLSSVGLKFDEGTLGGSNFDFANGMGVKGGTIELDVFNSDQVASKRIEFKQDLSCCFLFTPKGRLITVQACEFHRG